jgi:hypothetical protein
MLHLPAGETIAAWHPKTERRRTKVNFIILISISILVSFKNLTTLNKHKK